MSFVLHVSVILLPNFASVLIEIEVPAVMALVRNAIIETTNHTDQYAAFRFVASTAIL